MALTMTLHLVRHGESVWNTQRRVQGQSPDAPGLTERGRAQAAWAASALGARAPIDRVLTSDLTRAVETARPIAAALGRVAEPDARLREQAMGILETKLTTEAFEWWTDETWTDDDHLGVTGESTNQVRARVRSLLDDVRADEATGAAVLVGHGGSIRVALGLLVAGHPGFGHDLDVVANCSITTARLVSGDLVDLSRLAPPA